MSNIETLLVTKKVYYIYDIRGPAFSINNNLWEYLVIVDDSFQEKKTEEKIKFIKISYWFKLIEEGEILPWICACLNKKYILKEHVKLLMTTDLLKLRKNYNKAKKEASSPLSYLELFARLKFTNQIIDNHKIKNFNLSKEADLLLNAEDVKQTFYSLAFKEEQYLYKNTDGILLKDKLKCKHS